MKYVKCILRAGIFHAAVVSTLPWSQFTETVDEKENQYRDMSERHCPSAAPKQCGAGIVVGPLLDMFTPHTSQCRFNDKHMVLTWQHVNTFLV